MKIASNKINYLILIFITSSLYNMLSSASCEEDNKQMQAQIDKYGSVTSADRQFIINKIYNVYQMNNCFADAEAVNIGHIKIDWVKGNWANSLSRVCY